MVMLVVGIRACVHPSNVPPHMVQPLSLCNPTWPSPLGRAKWGCRERGVATCVLETRHHTPSLHGFIALAKPLPPSACFVAGSPWQCPSMPYVCSSRVRLECDQSSLPGTAASPVLPCGLNYGWYLCPPVLALPCCKLESWRLFY